jgi:uncharacterized protein YjiS (DUF1127 family)
VSAVTGCVKAAACAAPAAPDRRAGAVSILLRRAAGRAVGLVRLWLTRMQESRELAELTDRELRDINVTRDEAERASRKPFWKA